MPTVTVRYFASLRERRGVQSEDIEFESGETLQQLYARLFPPGPLGTVPVAYVRNKSSSIGSQAMQHGDEVSFLPPFGGG
jgi:molybdopterin converting factor small subunit